LVGIGQMKRFNLSATRPPKCYGNVIVAPTLVGININIPKATLPYSVFNIFVESTYILILT
jgi:hypothetical protein